MHLIRSCEKWGIEHCIEGIESQGSWELNCAVKPFYILEKLEQHRRPIFWVDADAVFLKEPKLDQFPACDFSVRIEPYLHEADPSKVISCTIYVNYSNDGRQILRKWADECKKRSHHPPFWDQVALRDVLLTRKRAKILPMPLPYCTLLDFDDFFIRKEDIVIKQFQASRRFKNYVY